MSDREQESCGFDPEEIDQAPPVDIEEADDDE